MTTCLVNLTTHVVTVYAGERAIASWEPSGAFARIVEAHHTGAPLATDRGEIPVTGVSYTGEVIDLPQEAPGTAYLVSRVLAERVRRDDLYFPFDEVRDPSGRIIGCRGLGHFTTAEGSDAG